MATNMAAKTDIFVSQLIYVRYKDK